MRKYFCTEKKNWEEIYQGDGIAHCRRGGCIMDNCLYFSFLKCSTLNMYLLKSLLSKCIYLGFSLWSDWVGSLQNNFQVYRCVFTSVCITKSSFPVDSHVLADLNTGGQPLLIAVLVSGSPGQPCNMSVLSSKLAHGPASGKVCQIIRADHRTGSAHRDACKDLREAMAHSFFLEETTREVAPGGGSPCVLWDQAESFILFTVSSISV